ncbi:hypothetical protein [Duganella sp. Root1480D1]|uniref:hypothetical protein n=1 Tax=Duganella sp. Root1480D1 TaxID=1736471 RepID=UPI00070C9B5A|nr:hypothetical protein [Duganella sp. Root1480D1]KQZ31799.1 hypothetical protein ASD58_29770 [Duganella sp. Root1480D1]
MNSFEASHRMQWIGRINTAPSFLDSVFMFSLYKRKQVYCHFPEITPREALGDYDESEFSTCMQRAVRLWSCSCAMGESALCYRGAKPLEEAVRLMTEEHPGFSNECYNEVIYMGMFEMR